MGPIHPVSIVAGAVWACTVLLAISFGGMSASAGILPKPWMGVGMFCGFINVVLVVVGVCYLPASTPRIVLRLLQLVGMAGAFWSTGTLTRVIYALVV